MPTSRPSVRCARACGGRFRTHVSSTRARSSSRDCGRASEALASKNRLARGVRFPGRWALAATVLLALACGLAYRGRDWVMATGALARAAVGDHRDCALLRQLAGISIPLEEATERYGGATYRILGRYRRAMS